MHATLRACTFGLALLAGRRTVAAAARRLTRGQAARLADALADTLGLCESHPLHPPLPSSTNTPLPVPTWQCVNPTFICDHPQIMSPLAKWCALRVRLCALAL